jgi:hypothetical protein
MRGGTRLATLATLAAIAAVLLPGSASAAVVEIGAREVRAGPVLAGSSVVWADARPGEGGFALRSASAAGGAPTTVREFGAAEGLVLTPSLAASPERIVLSYATGDSSELWRSRTVLTGPPGGALTELDAGCRLGGIPDVPRVADVSAQAVAFPRCDASGRQASFVRDHAAPVTMDEQVPAGSPGGLRVAGRYLAWLDPGGGQLENRADVVVYDRTIRSVVYRVARGSMSIRDLDLQADGKVAFTFTAPGGSGVQIAWASPAEPTAHVLALPAAQSHHARIASDRIGFESGPSTSRLPRTVGVAGLGGSVTTLATDAESDISRDDFDFDGSRAAWWSYDCTQAQINVAAADAPARPAGPRSGCALRLRGRPRVESGRIVRLAVDCFGFALGECQTQRVTLTAGGGRKAQVVGRGKSARRIELGSTGRRTLRERGRLAVRARVLFTDAARRREWRAANLVLKRAR